MAKEKLLGLSTWLKVSKRSSLRLNAQAQGSAGGHGSHVCCRAVPSLGTHGSGKEETLLTLSLLHVSFNPSRNRWCPLKGRAISLAGAKELSPSEMPQSLSIYNTWGRSKSRQVEKLPATLHRQVATAIGRRKLCGGDPEVGEILDNLSPQPCQNHVA